MLKVTSSKVHYFAAHTADFGGGGGGHMMRSPQGGLSSRKGRLKVVRCPCRGSDPTIGNPRAQKPPLGRVPPPPVWGVRLDPPQQQQQQQQQQDCLSVFPSVRPSVGSFVCSSIPSVCPSPIRGPDCNNGRVFGLSVSVTSSLLPSCVAFRPQGHAGVEHILPHTAALSSRPPWGAPHGSSPNLIHVVLLYGRPWQPLRGSRPWVCNAGQWTTPAGCHCSPAAQ